MQQKPKKALRGLFTRTEPTTRVEDSVSVLEVGELVVSAASAEIPSQDLPIPVSPPAERVGASASKTEVALPSTKPEVKPLKPLSTEKQRTTRELAVEPAQAAPHSALVDVTSHRVAIEIAAPSVEAGRVAPETHAASFRIEIGESNGEPGTEFETEPVAALQPRTPAPSDVTSHSDMGLALSEPSVLQADALMDPNLGPLESETAAHSTNSLGAELAPETSALLEEEVTSETLAHNALGAPEPSSTDTLRPSSAPESMALESMVADAHFDSSMPFLTVLPLEKGVVSHATSISHQETSIPAAMRNLPDESVEPSSMASFGAPRHGAEGASSSAVEALGNVVRGFNATAVDRSGWLEDEYLAYIRRIDQAQTEAFLLKGKLLEEVKRRFFEDTKTGWKRFCEDRLDMNYTTANQYIRVAEEFESIAKERPDFGFEHFKALLPLPADQRSEILARAESLSVKSLRKLVQEKLTPSLPAAQTQDTQEAKGLVRSLEQLKEQILGGDFGSLPQLQRWQLAAACQNLSEELGALAGVLNRSSREAGPRSTNPSPRTAEERPGASFANSGARDVDSNL